MSYRADKLGDGRTQATTIPEGQYWPRVMIGNLHININNQYIVIDPIRKLIYILHKFACFNSCAVMVYVKFHSFFLK